MAVEADRTGEAVARGGGDPRRATAVAEPDGEDLRAALLPETLDRRAHVGLNAFVGRQLDVRQPIELLTALLHSGRASEVVECERGEPALGEPKRELLVEVVEAADIGK